MPPKEHELRFWSHVDRHGPVSSHRPDLGACWLWTGYLTKGYGRFKFDGRRMLAHRFSYELEFGTDSAGPELDHLCRVHNCVRPSHLEPVTHRENVIRGDAPILALARVNALWRGKTACPLGHPYDHENTYLMPSGGRDCRICTRRRGREYRARKKAG